MFTLGGKGLCLSLRSGGGVGSYIFTYSLGFVSCGMTHICSGLSIWLSLHHPRPGKFRERENDVVFLALSNNLSLSKISLVNEITEDTELVRDRQEV